jgi:hypothetical protein
MQFGLFMMPLHPPERPFTESEEVGPWVADLGRGCGGMRLA